MKTHSHKVMKSLVFALIAATAVAAEKRINAPAPSPESTLTQKVGFTTIQIKYSRPGVRGREVFGKLEPFGQVWRTGANEATKISFSTPVKFGGIDVPAGEYALFSIPDPREWTVILNRVTGQWGAYKYDQKNDVARVKAAPVKVSPAVETFTIDINDIRDDAATLNLVWQETRVPVKLAFDVVPTVLRQIEEAEASGQKLSAGENFSAALFYLEHGQDLKKAVGFIDAAIAQRPQFYFYYHKARILAKQGDKTGAAAAAQKSIEMAKAEGGSVADEYIRLNQTVLDSLK